MVSSYPSAVGCSGETTRRPIQRPRALSDWPASVTPERAATDRWAGSTTVEVGEVFCLGLCAVGPSGTVDGTLHAALSPERLDALAQGWRG